MIINSTFGVDTARADEAVFFTKIVERTNFAVVRGFALVFVLNKSMPDSI